MIRFYGLLMLIDLALLVIALIDCLSTDEFSVRNLPKVVWALGAWLAASAVAVGRLAGGWRARRAALVSTAISLFCGVLAGYALARLNFPFAGSLGTGIFVTYLVPQTLLRIVQPPALALRRA